MCLSDSISDNGEGKTEPKSDGKGEDSRSDLEIGDLIQAEVNGQLQFSEPKRIRAIQVHEGQKWVFVDGHKAGILMEQARPVEPSETTSPDKIPTLIPPTLPLVDDPSLWHEERLIDDNGAEIFVRFKHKPSPEHYAYVRDYYEFKLSRISQRKGALPAKD